MASHEPVKEGQIEVKFTTALGTFSCTMDPVEVAGRVLKAAQSLQQAHSAAPICDDICTDISETIRNRLPLVCELLRLGQLFPEREGVPDLNHALRGCLKSVCEALHDAVTALYEHLQCSHFDQQRRAESVKELLEQKRTRLTNRFNDIKAYTDLAFSLRDKQSIEQTQHMKTVKQELYEKLRELERVQTADKALVKARAKAALAQQLVEEQEFRVMTPVFAFFAYTSVEAMAVSPCGSKFAAVGRGGSVTVWEVATGTCVLTMTGHANVVGSVAWSPDGSELATASWDDTAAVWDAATGKRTHELRGHSSGVGSVAWSPDGSRLATSSWDDHAIVWDARTGTRMHELRGHVDTVKSIVWSPDGSRLATGSRDHTAAVWDAGNGTRMHELRGHSSVVMSVAWSPDGSKIATASLLGNTGVWDALTGTHMRELRGHCSTVILVEWNLDGSMVATVTCGGNPVVWDAATGERVHVLRKHHDRVTCLLWGPDGRSLWTASRDGTVRVYSVEPTRA